MDVAHIQREQTPRTNMTKRKEGGNKQNKKDKNNKVYISVKALDHISILTSIITD